MSGGEAEIARDLPTRELPAAVCGSLCWGDGPERHTLFLMTSTTAHMVATKVGPAPLPPF